MIVNLGSSYPSTNKRLVVVTHTEKKKKKMKMVKRVTSGMFNNYVGRVHGSAQKGIERGAICYVPHR